MSVKLVMFDSKGRRRAFALSQAETIIGRAMECGLRIPLIEVSREHCLLTIREDSVRLKDLGSTNGTYVNSKRISQVKLQAGDRLTIGPVVLTVQVNGVPVENLRADAQTARGVDDSGETVMADIEAAIALGPDELEDSRTDIDAIMASDQDPMTALESLGEQAADEPEPPGSSGNC